MADFLILPSEQDAETRSRDAWASVLGRKKNPQDVTEFLWGWDVGKDGRTALIIKQNAALLTPQEAATKTSILPEGKGDNWEKASFATVANGLR